MISKLSKKSGFEAEITELELHFILDAEKAKMNSCLELIERWTTRFADIAARIEASDILETKKTVLIEELRSIFGKGGKH